MKTKLREHGAIELLQFMPEGYAEPISLPVITHGARDSSGAWSWNGDREKPTLKPSIRTQHVNGTVSHIWLTDGVANYLADSTDGNAGKSMPLVDLDNTKVRDAASDSRKPKP